MRRTLIYLHLVFAGFMAPAFILLAISGGGYLFGFKGATQDSPVPLPAGASLDFAAPGLEGDVRELLREADVDHDFEYIRNRGTRIELRPTSRTYLSLAQTPDGLRATRHVPNLQKSMIELHKGHGPRVFKLYQKIVAFTLIGVVLGGVVVGLLAKAWRRPTLVAMAVGTLVFVVLVLA